MSSLFDTWAQIGPLKILAGAAAIMLVCTLWYSPFLFQKSWIRLSGIRPGDIRAGDMRRSFIVNSIAALITSALIALVAAKTPGAALFSCAAFIWMFVMLEQLTHVLWERQPFALFLLQTFRSLASLMACAAVFYFWS